MADSSQSPLEVELLIQTEDAYAAAVDEQLLTSVARAVLGGEGVTGRVEVGVRITDAAELHQLNRQFRGVDKSTDVLSFGNEDDEDGEGEDDAPFYLPPEEEDDEPFYLGDLAISYDHVVEQAQDYGHSRRRELCYLLAHGLLHLLGHDHEEQAEAAAMREREERYLGALGLTREQEPPEPAA